MFFYNKEYNQKLIASKEKIKQLENFQKDLFHNNKIYEF